MDMGARRDPRAEPSVPPGEERVDKLGDLPPHTSPGTASPPAATDAAPEERAPASGSPASPASSASPAASAGRVVTSVDPRIEAVESALATGDWRKIAADLGPLAKAGALPPTLGIVCAVAHREIASEEAAQEANDLAIRSAAALFGVPQGSALAMVLAKRVMRKNPVAWQKRPAPPARTSLLIIAATLIVGGGIGWLFSSGLVKLHVHF